MRIKRKAKGFTLIELLIVLGITAVMSAGMYLIYNSVMTSQKTTAEVNNLNILKSGIENLYATNAKGYGTAGDITATIAKSSVPIASMVKDSSSGIIYNAWGKPYKITSTVNGSNFTITEDVPQAACEKISQAVVNSWAGVKIASTEVKKAGGDGTFDINNIITTCSAITTGDATLVLTANDAVG